MIKVGITTLSKRLTNLGKVMMKVTLDNTGYFDVDRKIKFQLAGKVELNQYWLYQMIAAILIGALLTIFGLRNQKVNISHAFAYAIAAQGMAFGIVMAAIYPFINYMNFGMWVMWGMGSFLMIPLVISL